MSEKGRQRGVLFVIGFGLKLLLKAVAWSVVVAIPLMGVWAASSLAAYWNGPRWAAPTAGLVVFPLLPLAWEAFASWRRSRRESARPPILTLSDRMILRSFALSAIFLGGFLSLYPVSIFEALAGRGDWMLDGRNDPTSESLRRTLLATADRMSWLYEWANENEFATEEPTPPPPEPVPAPEPRRAPGPRPSSVEEPTDPSLPQDPHAVIAVTRGDEPPSWPLPEVPHPATLDIPAEHETSLTAVARYIASRESDPYLRAKALHDYVAQRVSYDVPALSAAERPAQDAETVFRTRRAVCEGYARLMVAMGEAVGLHIVYLHGNVRGEADGISGTSHAWNAVEIEGRWYLLDATWDAGSVNGTTFTPRYHSDYFMTPPELFSIDHLPSETRWQLRPDPIGRGEFARQARMRPSFFRAGLELVSPRRSQITVGHTFEARLRNPRGVSLLARARRVGSTGRGRDCRVSSGSVTDIRCELGESDRWTVLLFASASPAGVHWEVGSFQVASRMAGHDPRRAAEGSSTTANGLAGGDPPVSDQRQPLDPDPGRHVVAVARQMLRDQEPFRGSCYRFLAEVFERAGHANWRQQRVIYRAGREGPYASLDVIRPGDWLYIVNHPERTPPGTHSVLFVDWSDQTRGSARVIDHAGWRAGPVPGSESFYNLQRTYRVLRPVARR